MKKCIASILILISVSVNFCWPQQKVVFWWHCSVACLGMFWYAQEAVPSYYTNQKKKRTIFETLTFILMVVSLAIFPLVYGWNHSESPGNAKQGYALMAIAGIAASCGAAGALALLVFLRYTFPTFEQIISAKREIMRFLAVCTFVFVVFYLGCGPRRAVVTGIVDSKKYTLDDHERFDRYKGSKDLVVVEVRLARSGKKRHGVVDSEDLRRSRIPFNASWIPAWSWPKREPPHVRIGK